MKFPRRLGVNLLASALMASSLLVAAPAQALVVLDRVTVVCNAAWCHQNFQEQMQTYNDWYDGYFAAYYSTTMFQVVSNDPTIATNTMDSRCTGSPAKNSASNGKNIYSAQPLQQAAAQAAWDAMKAQLGGTDAAMKSWVSGLQNQTLDNGQSGKAMTVIWGDGSSTTFFVTYTSVGSFPPSLGAPIKYKTAAENGNAPPTCPV